MYIEKIVIPGVPDNTWTLRDGNATMAHYHSLDELIHERDRARESLPHVLEGTQTHGFLVEYERVFDEAIRAEGGAA